MTPSLDHFPFARPHLHGVCAKAARLHPSSLGRAATLNHPEHYESLPAGGRSLMGGCASRRETRAQGCAHALFIFRAIRPTRHINQRQRSSGTALGLRWGMYRTTCAVGTTGRRFAGLGCHRRGFEFPAPRGYDLLTGRGLVGSGLFSSALSHIDGIGRRANVPFANLIHRHQGRFQRFAKGQPRHFRNSRLNAINLDRGGHDGIHEHSASGAANDR